MANSFCSSTAGSAQPSSSDTPNGYVELRLGEGSFGRVVLMSHATLPNFARKLGHIARSITTNTHVFAKEYHILKMARDENQAHIIRLNPRRPGQPDQVSRKAEMIYFDMEFASKGNLREWIQNSPLIVINEAMVCWVGSQIASGLLWLHGKQYLHGDIKPENILVVPHLEQPIVKIGDVGSAVAMSRSGNAFPNTIEGCITTPLYAAPEMLLAGIDGNRVKNRAPGYEQYKTLVKPVITLAADIYSFGVTLEEVAGTQHPEYPVYKFPGLNQVENMLYIHSKRPHDLRVFNIRFQPSPPFTQLLSDLTRFYPQDRPTIAAVCRRPILNQGNFRITKWPFPDQFETLSEEVKTLKSRLAGRENELIITQQRLLLSRQAAIPKVSKNSETQTTPLHSPTPLPLPIQSPTTLTYQPSPLSTFPPLVIDTHLPVPSPLPVRSPSPLPLDLSTHSPSTIPKTPTPLPNAVASQNLLDEVIRVI